MYLSLHVEAGKTKEFLKYIAEYLSAKKPFVNGEVIDIPISDNSAYLPKLEERYAGGGDKEAELGEIKDHAGRKEIRQTTIAHFLKTEFHNALEYRTGVQDPHNPLVYLISFKIKDKLKLENRIAEINAPEKVAYSPTSELKTNPLRICFMGKEVTVTEGTIQSRVCEIMFEKPFRSMVEMADLIDEACGANIENPKTKWRSMYNALNLVNQEVKEATGEKIFKTGKLRLSRIR